MHTLLHKIRCRDTRKAMGTITSCREKFWIENASWIIGRSSKPAESEQKRPNQNVSSTSDFSGIYLESTSMKDREIPPVDAWISPQVAYEAPLNQYFVSYKETKPLWAKITQWSTVQREKLILTVGGIQNGPTRYFPSAPTFSAKIHNFDSGQFSLSTLFSEHKMS